MRAFVRSVQGRAIGFGLVIGAIMGTVWSSNAAWGFLTGTAVSVMNFQLMAVDAYSLADQRPARPRRFIITRFLIRFAIMFGFISLVVTRTDFNIVTAFIGLFFVQAVMFGGQVYDSLKHRT